MFKFQGFTWLDRKSVLKGIETERSKAFLKTVEGVALKHYFLRVIPGLLTHSNHFAQKFQRNLTEANLRMA